MALSPRLELKHSQTLVMTPQLQQAIKLLQLTNMELGDFVAQEVEKNPLLEYGEPGESAGEGRADGPTLDSPAGEDATGAAQPPESASGTDVLLKEASSGTSDALDTDFENVFNNDSAADSGFGADAGGGLSLNGMSVGGANGFDGAGMDFEQNLTAATTLKSHLEAQLPHAQFSAAEEMIAHFLIDMVDEAGYLRDELSVVSDKLGCAVPEVEAVLQRLQTFEPSGVFARDLKECLAIQLRDRDRLDPAMATLLDHLDLLARRDLNALKRICEVDGEDLADMILEIRALDPKPGLPFSSEETQPVVPDVFIRRGFKGNWIIELNTETLPKVLLNASYHAEITGRTRSKEDKAFVSECFATANWLIKALDQRAKTILKVATEITRQQEGFFLHGVKHLRPLNLRMIADAINMHESTVSRVTTNKYLASERGIFELKYFFTSAIAAAGEGEAHSAEAVKERIRELIAAEDPERVLSDDRIVEILRSEEIDIARRTVAKYREALRIPSSVQRRRMKAIAV